MSIKIKIYNQEGEIVGDEELSEKVFDVPGNIPLLHQVMVAQTASKRQVLAHTKDRSEVRGGGKKPWRQKGTGRARAGSSRSPIWIGGGVTFGPTKDRNFKKKINQKMRQKAILMILSDRLREASLAVIDKIIATEFKTKAIDNFLKKLETKVLIKTKDAKSKKDKKEIKIAKRSFLIINDVKDEKLTYSTRNLAGVKMINLENINIIDLLKYKNFIMTQTAVKKIEARYIK